MGRITEYRHELKRPVNGEPQKRRPPINTNPSVPQGSIQNIPNPTKDELKAIQALVCLGENPTNTSDVRKIVRLIALLNTGSPDAKANAARALGILAFKNSFPIRSTLAHLLSGLILKFSSDKDESDPDVIRVKKLLDLCH